MSSYPCDINRANHHYFLSYQTSDVSCVVVFKVLSVTYVKGGDAYDRTPSFVEFGGTLRSLTTEGLERLQRRVEEVCLHIVFYLHSIYFCSAVCSSIFIGCKF